MTFCKNISVPFDFDSHTLRSTSLARLLNLPLFIFHPRSSATFGVKICGPYKWRPSGLVMRITEANIKPGLSVPYSLARYVNGYLMAQVQNKTDSTVHLSPGTRISYARPCDSDITVFKVNVPPVIEPSDHSDLPTEADLRYGRSLAQEADLLKPSSTHIKIPSGTILSPEAQENS